MFLEAWNFVMCIHARHAGPSAYVFLAETTVYCSETAYASLIKFFFSWYNENTVTLSLQSDWSRIVSAVVLVVVLTPACATSCPHNFCSMGPRGLKFFMHSNPLMGGSEPKFQKKIRRKKFFFRLISPTHYPVRNSCSNGPRGLKFVMRIDPPLAGPTTTFLF